MISKRLQLGFVALAVLLVFACTTTSSTRFLDLQPGNYLATTEHTDEDGWAPFLYVVVNDTGTVEHVRFDYFDAHRGSFRTENTDYGDRMQAAVGVSPVDYVAILTEELEESKTIPVDTISGATISSDWFNLLADQLLLRIQAGDNRPVLVPMSAHYTAQDVPDEQGWIGMIQIATEGRTVQSVEFDEIKLNEAGEIEARKSEGATANWDWIPPHHDSMTELYDTLSAQLIAEGRPSGVDVIASATQSSQRFRDRATEALDSRRLVDFVELGELLQ